MSDLTASVSSPSSSSTETRERARATTPLMALAARMKAKFVSLPVPEQCMLAGGLTAIACTLLPWARVSFTMDGETVGESCRGISEWGGRLFALAMVAVSASVMKPELINRVKALSGRASLVRLVIACVATLLALLYLAQASSGAGELQEMNAALEAIGSSDGVSAGATMFCWLALLASSVATFGAFKRLRT
jgi:hypothetical protein